MKTYTLHDTFNDKTVSRHRSIEAAVRASYRFSRAVRRANGSNSYIPTVILCDGHPLNESQQQDAQEIRWRIETGMIRACPARSFPALLSSLQSVRNISPINA